AARMRRRSPTRRCGDSEVRSTVCVVAAMGVGRQAGSDARRALPAGVASLATAHARTGRTLRNRHGGLAGRVLGGGGRAGGGGGRTLEARRQGSVNGRAGRI